MWILCQHAIVNIMDACMQVYFFSHCLTPRKFKGAGNIVPFAVLFPAGIVLTSMNQSAYRTCVAMLIYFIIMVVCYSDKLTFKIFIGVMGVTCMMLSELMSSIMYLVLWGEEAFLFYLLDSLDPRIITARCGYVCVYIIVGSLFVHLWRKRKIRKNHVQFFAFAFFIVVQVSLIMAVLKCCSYPSTRQFLFALLPAFLLGVMSSFLLVDRLEKLSDQNLLTEQLAQIELIRQIEYKYYCRIKDDIQEIRTIRHDAQNHIQVIELLLKGTKTEQKYADRIKEEFAVKLGRETRKMEHVYSHNSLLNYIFSDYLCAMENGGKYEIWIGGDMPEGSSGLTLITLFVTKLIEFIQKHEEDLSRVKMKGNMKEDGFELEVCLYVHENHQKAVLKQMNENIEFLRFVMEESGGRFLTDDYRDENKFQIYAVS